VIEAPVTGPMLHPEGGPGAALRPAEILHPTIPRGFAPLEIAPARGLIPSSAPIWQNRTYRTCRYAASAPFRVREHSIMLAPRRRRAAQTLLGALPPWSLILPSAPNWPKTRFSDVRKTPLKLPIISGHRRDPTSARDRKRSVDDATAAAGGSIPRTDVTHASCRCRFNVITACRSVRAPRWRCRSA
jgi:hypothetical protein